MHEIFLETTASLLEVNTTEKGEILSIPDFNKRRPGYHPSGAFKIELMKSD